MNNKSIKDKNLTYEVPLKWVLLFWAIAIGVAFYFGGKEGAIVAGVIAAISLFFQLIKKNSSWEGEVIDLYTKEQRQSSNNDEGQIPGTQIVNIAKIKMPNGKNKEVVYNPSHHEIKIGDKIIKKRGKEFWQIIKS